MPSRLARQLLTESLLLALAGGAAGVAAASGLLALLRRFDLPEAWRWRHSESRSTFTADGYEPAPDEELRVDAMYATPGHAGAVGLPVLAGRDLAEGDGADGEPIALVSQSMADRYWPSGDAVGGTVRLSGTPLRVVGVAGDATWNGLDEQATSYMYLPLALSPGVASDAFLTLAARTEGDAEALLGSIRSLANQLDREVTISRQATMPGLVADVLMPQRLGALLLSTFGLLALVLSAAGIAGVVAYAVSRRRREIGLRVALGASRATVLRGLARSMSAPVLLGVLLGVLAARSLSRVIEGCLFGARPTDPATYSAIVLGVLTVAAVAVLVAARSALRVEPSEVLKAEEGGSASSTHGARGRGPRGASCSARILPRSDPLSCHSDRSASMGSTLVARRAGTYAATAATTASTAPTVT